MNSLQGNKVWLAQISTTLLLSLLPSSGYVVSLPFIRQEWGLSNTLAGFVFSSYLIGFAVSSLVLVPMADQVAPGRMMVAGISVMVFSHLLFPLVAYGPWIAMLLRALAGAGHVMAYVLGIHLVTDRFEGKHRGTAVGLFVSTGYAGTTISYTLIGVLLNQLPSWRTAYLYATLLAIVGLLLAINVAERGSVEGADGMRSANSTPTQNGNHREGRRVLDVNVLRNRPTALVVIAYALHTAELYLARLWLPLLLGSMLVFHGRQAAEATADAATWSGLMFMTGILGAFFGGLISDHLGRTIGAIIIFTASGICSFLIGWLVNVPIWLPMVLGFIYGFATAADSAIYSTAAVELSPAGRIASVQAIQSFVGFTVGAVVPVIAGSILDVADETAGWGLAFSFNGMLAVFGVVALLLLRRSEKSDLPVLE